MKELVCHSLELGRGRGSGMVGGRGRSTTYNHEFDLIGNLWGIRGRLYTVGMILCVAQS